MIVVTKERGGIIGLLAALLLGLIVLYIGVATVPRLVVGTPVITPPPMGPFVPECASLVHYFANDPGKEAELSFGPDAEGTGVLSDVEQEFRHRMCLDPALYVALMTVVDGSPHNRIISPAEWKREVTDLLNRRIRWQTARLDTYTADGPQHYTLMMRPDAQRKAAPGIEATLLPERARTSTYLVLQVLGADGTYKQLQLRLHCGFQPVVPSLSYLAESLRSILT